MSMKKVLSIVLAAILVLSLAACTGSTPSSSGSAAPGSEASGSSEVKKDPVSLEYWFEGAGPERTPIHEGITKGFNDQSDYITVNGVYVDLEKGMDKVNVAWAGGAMPDVIYMQDSWESSMFAQGMCLQLDDLFEAWDEKDQFDASCLTAIREKDMQGRLFGIPTATNVTGIWYRKDIFKEKGIEPPTTWDNFFNAVEKLTDKSAGVYGHTLRGGSGSTSQLMNELICYCGYDAFFSEDGKAQILRSAEAEEYINRFADIYKKGQTPESGLTAGFKEMVADFNANLAMTLIHNLGSYENQRQTFTDDQYGFYPFPESVKGGRYAQLGNSKGLCVVATTKYPDEAWEYVKWNASEDAISAINEAVGELPSRIDSASHDWVKNAPHMSNLPAYTAEKKTVVSRPSYLADYNSIEKNYAEPALQEVLVGKKTAREFLDGWADLYEPAYAEYLQQKK